jgi:hypothetical protein
MLPQDWGLREKIESENDIKMAENYKILKRFEEGVRRENYKIIKFDQKLRIIFRGVWKSVQFAFKYIVRQYKENENDKLFVKVKT